LANPQSLSGRPNLQLFLDITTSGATVTWYLKFIEAANQPTFSNFPADNKYSYDFTAGGGPSASNINFTYTFQPTGLQTIVLASGSFTATSSGFTAYASVDTSNSLAGDASVDQAIYPSLPPPPTPAPVFSDASVSSSASVGVAYSDGVAASNSPSYSVVSEALPTGLNLNSGTGAITGTPTTPGVFTFVIRASNAGGSVDTGTLTITVIGGGKVWNGTSFVSGTTKAWNGTSFVSTTTKIWNGSSWVSAT
jgi:hypothetical protein